MSRNPALLSNHSRLLQSRLDTLRDSTGYRAYERARERVSVIKDLEAAHQSAVHAPSAYWREELSGFEYMLDASPLVVDKLRHHTYHVTGLRTYDYRSNQDKGRSRFAKKLDALIEAAGGRDLLVQIGRASCRERV